VFYIHLGERWWKWYAGYKSAFLLLHRSVEIQPEIQTCICWEWEREEEHKQPPQGDSCVVLYLGRMILASVERLEPA